MPSNSLHREKLVREQALNSTAMSLGDLFTRIHASYLSDINQMKGDYHYKQRILMHCIYSRGTVAWFYDINGLLSAFICIHLSSGSQQA